MKFILNKIKLIEWNSIKREGFYLKNKDIFFIKNTL